LKRLFKPSLYELVQNEESIERGACKQCLGITTEVDAGSGGQKFKKRATSKSHDDSMTSSDSYSDVSVVGTTTPRRQGTLRKNISMPGSVTSQRTTPLGSMEILPDVSASLPPPGTPTRLPPRQPPKGGSKA